MIKWLILFYKKHISKHKGFKCASGIMTGESCSDYVLNRMNSGDSFYSSYKDSRKRCKGHFEEYQSKNATKCCDDVPLLYCPDMGICDVSGCDAPSLHCHDMGSCDVSSCDVSSCDVSGCDVSSC
jgi:hypothetical protein